MLILLSGDSNQGKTVSSCTFIEACDVSKNETMLMLDLNDGFESVKNARDKTNNLVVPRWEEILVEKFYKESVQSLYMKTAEKEDFKSKVAPSYTVEAVVIVTKLNAIFNELADNKGLYKGKQIKVLGIDAISDMFRIWKEGVMNVNKIPSLRISDYLTLESMLFGQFIPTLKSLGQYIPWIILCNHITMDKDEVLGSIEEFPIGPSNAMGRLMSKDFSEVWKMAFTGGEYVWRTKNSGFFKAGSRLSLPDPVKPATYKRLESILEGRKYDMSGV